MHGGWPSYGPESEVSQQAPGMLSSCLVTMNAEVPKVAWPDGYAGKLGLMPGLARLVLGAPSSTHSLSCSHMSVNISGSMGYTHCSASPTEAISIKHTVSMHGAAAHLRGGGGGVLVNTADADDGPPEFEEVLFPPRLRTHACEAQALS